MAEKKIIVGGNLLMYGTSIKASPEINTNTTTTFDGVITQGSENVSWSIEMSRVRFNGLSTYKKISSLLDSMLTKTKTVTIVDTVKTGSETFVIRDTFYGCLLEGNDYEIKPDENTVENIKFKASRRVREYE